jgi:hypothetical protein
MAGDSRQAAASRPAAVPIHDDGDVLGQPDGIDGVRKGPVPITRLKRFQ